MWKFPPAKPAVEKQRDDVVAPRIELASRQGCAETHGAPLRRGNDHHQKLLRCKRARLDTEARILELTRQQIANQCLRLLRDTLGINQTNQLGKPH